MAKITNRKQAAMPQTMQEKYRDRLIAGYQRFFPAGAPYIPINGETRQYLSNPVESLGSNNEPSYESKMLKPLARYVQHWLGEESGNLLVILGEYGSGKTSFLRDLAHKLVVSLNAPFKPIPLYFRLNDFESEMEPFIVSQLNHAGMGGIGFQGFLEMLQNNEFILLLDGFDEMTENADNGDVNEAKEKFRKVRGLIDHSPHSKVILTVSTEYFQSGGDYREVFGDPGKPDGKINDRFIHLMPFDDEQVLQYLHCYTDAPAYYMKQINTLFGLRDLAGRPGLLQVIARYLPDVIESKDYGSPIAASDFFNHCMREADYPFHRSHRLFRDYSAARACVEEINGNDINDFGREPVSKGINHFIREQKPDREMLLNLVLTAKVNDLTKQYRWQGTNAANVLLKMDPEVLKGCDLSGCGLAFVDFRGCDLTGTDFSGADVSDCQFDGSARFARFENAVAANVRLDLSDLALRDWQLAGLSLFRELHGLTHVNLRNNRVTDLLPVRGLTELTDLNLMGNNVTDLSPLQCLTGLTRLHLSKNKVSDLSPLRQLTRLSVFHLIKNSVSDLAPLEELAELTTLYLSSNDIIDLSPLRQLTRLKILYLSSNRISDLSPLRQLTALKALDLRYNQISDLSPLRELTQLEKLRIRDNPVTGMEINALQEALPGLLLYH